MRRNAILLLSSCALALAGCDAVFSSSTQNEEAATQGLGQLFEDYDAAQLDLSPQGKSFRGIRDGDYGKWSDVSDEADVRRQELIQSTLANMRGEYDLASLPGEAALSYRLFEALGERSARTFEFRGNVYLFNQMRGFQSTMPAFLINIHSVESQQHALDYVSRIGGMGDVLDTLIAESSERAGNGVMPPDWVYPYVISDIQNLLNAGDDNAILDDFRGKVDALELDAEQADDLKASALAAWNQSARPAYERLLTEMQRQQQIAPTDDGVWRLPDGAAYYSALLQNYTTTDLSPDEIHQIGLDQVQRIHGEMRAIMEQVEFEGDLQDFFEFTRTSDRFFYTSREEYIADAQAKIDALGERMPEFFGVLPEDPLVIKPVEAFREKSAGKAFYQSPAPDGSRPGTYYVNLYNLRDMSRNELEALAYHEGLPGHHLQRSIQTALGEVPAFRRFGGVTAYSEGWGLYSEELGKDMGFYTDPYSDFGRLGMELWRACRLVVDTGIHHKRWSREEAIQYLAENTPNPQGDIRKAIERYIVYPGQATAYMIGKLKIMELRGEAQEALGDDFDIRGFHDVILENGPVPLSIMEENVDAWVESQS
ncbi:MAG: DUF885 domain-containing protein [Erythrobacter sp.]